MSKQQPVSSKVISRQELECTIADMDALARSVLQQIGSMVHIALVAMEHPRFYNNVTELARMLDMLADTVARAEADIAMRASDVGCSWDDHTTLARVNAQLQAMQFKPLKTL